MPKLILILWLDKMKLEVFGTNHRWYNWQSRNTPFEEKNLVPALKLGVGSIMILGCFAAAGTGKISRIYCTIDFRNTKQFCTEISSLHFGSWLEVGVEPFNRTMIKA